MDNSAWEDETFDWIMSFNNENLNETLKNLEMRTDGSKLSKVNRFNKWLLGNYSADDFAENDESEETTNHRCLLRESYIRSQVLQYNSNKQSDNDEDAHPLDGLLENEVISKRLNRTTAAKKDQNDYSLSIIDEEEESGEPQGSDDAGKSGQNTVNPIENISSDERQPDPSQERRSGQRTTQPPDNDQDKSQPKTKSTQSILLTSSDGSTFKLPIDISMTLANILTDMRAVKENNKSLHAQQVILTEEMLKRDDIMKNLQKQMVQLINSQKQVFSSTRIDEQKKSNAHVQFQDTFRTHYDNQNDTSTPERSGSLDDRQNNYPPVNQTGFARRDETFDISDTHQTNNQRSGNNDDINNNQASQTRSRLSESTFQTRDVGSIARKWGISYNGDRKESIESFLVKVEQCAELSRLSEAELVASLSELFKGTAATWYQNEKDTWVNWKQFKDIVTKWYGTSRGFQQQLIMDINARTQHPDEPTADFIIKRKALLKDLVPPLNKTQELDMLYQNLLPKIRSQIKRKEFNSVNELLEIAREVEATFEYEKRYRPPPPAESAWKPELGFRPLAAAKFSAEAKTIEQPLRQPAAAIAATQIIDAPTTNMMEQLIKAIGQLKIGKPQYQQSNNGQNSPNKRENSKKEQNTSEESYKKDSEQQKSSNKQRNWRKPNYDTTKPLTCRKCGKLGFMERYCPDCSKNEDRGE